jgi:hypothetical protein
MTLKGAQMQSRNTRLVWPAATCAALLLTGCTLNPAGAPLRVIPAPTQQPSGITSAPLPPNGLVTAAGAEQACIAAGRERGLDVLGVVGSREVAGSDGEMTRDVMLRVRRGNSVVEVRCNYMGSTQMARIMLI